MLGLSPWGGGGIYPNLLCPTQKCETHSGRCPMLPSPPSNTKHSVDLYHALTPMSCDVLVHNAMKSCHFSFIPCYIYDECYICLGYSCIITHASFGHLYKKAYKFKIYHTIHGIIPIHAYIDITSHYYLSSDIHQPLGRIVIRHVHN